MAPPRAVTQGWLVLLTISPNNYCPNRAGSTTQSLGEQTTLGSQKPLVCETMRSVTRIFDLLSAEQHHNFAVIGYLFAARTFGLLKQLSNLAWLEERGRDMDEFPSKASAYREIIERAHAQDLAQMRQTMVDFVQKDFPELIQLAEEVVATIDDLPQLGRLSAKLGGAQNADQARKILSQLAQ